MIQNGADPNGFPRSAYFGPASAEEILLHQQLGLAFRYAMEDGVYASVEYLFLEKKEAKHNIIITKKKNHKQPWMELEQAA